jgi:hypothetical protein
MAIKVFMEETKWVKNLQDVYSGEGEFKSYSENYGVFERLNGGKEGGFYLDIDEMWSENPVISGSTNPEDSKIITDDYGDPIYNLEYAVEIRDMQSAVHNLIVFNNEDDAIDGSEAIKANKDFDGADTKDIFKIDFHDIKEDSTLGRHYFWNGTVYMIVNDASYDV